MRYFNPHFWTVTKILFLGLLLVDSNATNVTRLLAQGNIVDFVPENRIITLNDKRTFKLDRHLKIMSNGHKYSLRLLKPGMRVFLYGYQQGDEQIIVRIQVQLSRRDLQMFTEN